jgi:hypothetical protein
MPYKSKAQAAYFHAHRKELEAQGVNVSEKLTQYLSAEWDKKSKGRKLPKRVKK